MHETLLRCCGLAGNLRAALRPSPEKKGPNERTRKGELLKTRLPVFGEMSEIMLNTTRDARNEFLSRATENGAAAFVRG